MTVGMLSFGHAPVFAWQVLPLGAGGYITGIAIAPDDTRVIKTDTYGGYIWTGSAWKQLVNTLNVPGANPIGLWEIAIAPGLTTRIAIIFNNAVYRSDDSGVTWNSANLSMSNAAANTGAPRLANRKMCIDPNNPDHVLVGMPNGSTPNSGVWETFNFGSATPSWTKVSSIANPTANPGCAGMVFDPSSGTKTVSGNIVTARALVPSGGNGVYETLDGGVTWALTTGTPTSVWTAQIGPTGSYYCAGGNTTIKVMRYLSSAWADISPSANYFAPNLAWGGGATCVGLNAGELTVTGSNGLWWGYRTTNADAGSVAWAGSSGGHTHTQNSAIGWQQHGDVSFAAVGDMVMNPSGNLIVAQGIGTWQFTNPLVYNFSGYSVVATSTSVGIEQLVANDICAPLGAAQPICAVWDRGVMTANLPGYPTDYFPSPNLTHAWALDYASSDPTFVAAVVILSSVNNSGFSHSSGATGTWQNFPTLFPTGDGGNIACATPSNIVITCGNASTSKILVTRDGGTTWTAPAGLPTGPSKPWSGGFTTRSRNVAADRVTIGTFVAYNLTDGLYRSTDGGSTWSLLTSSVLANTNGHEQFQFAPANAGHLWFTEGEGLSTSLLYKSTDAGSTKTAVASVTNVTKFCFGAAAPGASYPAIYIYGNVSGVPGFWRSNDAGATWTQLTGPLSTISPLKTIDTMVCMNGDMNTYGKLYLGFNGSGYAYAVNL